MSQSHSLHLPLLLLLLLSLVVAPTRALNIGVQLVDPSITLSKECSRKCESEFCAVPPLLRYGKYCGLMYSGCPGERPCDSLDACCKSHDDCVGAKNNDYLNIECSQSFINCMKFFMKSKSPSFQGNKCQVEEVIEVISIVMDAALIAGRIVHKPALGADRTFHKPALVADRIVHKP